MKQRPPSRTWQGGLSEAVGLLAIWTMLVSLTAHAQSYPANSNLPKLTLAPGVQELILRAKAGEAKAQRELGARLANGDEVPRNLTASVKWLRMAAEQDDAIAELNLGTCYFAGNGVAKNFDEAIKWFSKAAGHAPDLQNTPGPTIQPGTVLTNLTTLDGASFSNAIVENTYPDGISITYRPARGGFGMAKLQFRNLPDATQKACGYNPQAEAAYLIQQLAAQELVNAESVKQISERQTRRSEIASTLAGIVSDYHRSHVYLTNDSGSNIYVCGDMACDVWDMVYSKGVHAKIAVGSLDDDITSVAQATHAWVLAETTPGEWLALEATGGYVVGPADNRRYYYCCRFATAKDYRDFEELKRRYNDAAAKYRSARDDFKESTTGGDARGQLLQRQAVMLDRLSELTQLKAELDKLQLTNE